MASTLAVLPLQRLGVRIPPRVIPSLSVVTNAIPPVYSAVNEYLEFLGMDSTKYYRDVQSLSSAKGPPLAWLYI